MGHCARWAVTREVLSMDWVGERRRLRAVVQRPSGVRSHRLSLPRSCTPHCAQATVASRVW